jgi:hypothetical protein
MKISVWSIYIWDNLIVIRVVSHHCILIHIVSWGSWRYTSLHLIQINVYSLRNRIQVSVPSVQLIYNSISNLSEIRFGNFINKVRKGLKSYQSLCLLIGAHRKYSLFLLYIYIYIFYSSKCTTGINNFMQTNVYSSTGMNHGFFYNGATLLCELPAS